MPYVRVDSWFSCSCGHRFNDAEAVIGQRIERSEAYGHAIDHIDYYFTCPKCGSVDIVPFTHCEFCATDPPNEALEGFDWCADCFKAQDPEGFDEYSEFSPEILGG